MATALRGLVERAYGKLLNVKEGPQPAVGILEKRGRCSGGGPHGQGAGGAPRRRQDGGNMRQGAP